MQTPNKSAGQEELAEAITKIKELVNSSLPQEGYFDGFKSWLQDRTNDWVKTSLRIGLVGITSAGKSTFVNALAGEDILPRGAQPTSGVLVMCRKSSERKLRILFKDQSEYSFDGEECTPLWIKRYADEEENPTNEQNVQEIHLHLPRLMIPEKYDLIDSPGLDAFGLQGHEELTLRTLIPLVDVVLFLTTTKSTSDKENLKALGNICSEAKPAIVVQTHKDAVEPRYMKGGKILESAEQALEKHSKRVKDLLEQTMVLHDAHVIQVSSIQALNCRLQNPEEDPNEIEEWHESGFGEVVAVLEKLHASLSKNMAQRRLRLLLKEVQQLLDRVKTDYFSARGKEKEAQYYRDLEKQRLEDLQNGIPSDQEANFPDVMKFQKDIGGVKDFFTKALEEWKDEDLENLSTTVRDKVKGIEKEFFQKTDVIEERLKKIAEELSIDLQAVKPEYQKQKSNLPQIKRYEEIMQVEAIAEIGVGGRVKRLLGKFLQKRDWGYQEKNVTEMFIDREELKADISDYHSIYRVKLSGYLQQWIENWKNSTSAILTAISQRKDDVSSSAAGVDPEPYRILLSGIRAIRDEMEVLLSGDNNQRTKTMGFSALKYRKKQERFAQTTRTLGKMDKMLPLLHSVRTIVFTKKTQRFWHVIKTLCPGESRKQILISTPFSHEVGDYLTWIGDLTSLHEDQLSTKIVFYDTKEGTLPCTTLPVQMMVSSAQEEREQWFLEKTNIVLFHDRLLEIDGAKEDFQRLAAQADVIFRAVDLHQIGHEQNRLNKLEIRDTLEEQKEKLAYLGAGADRLLRGGQFIDAFKSYMKLKSAPGFGLRPFVLADGEELLTSLLWLANGIGKNKDEISDELQAFRVLTETQKENIAGRESFIRNFFREVKEFREEQGRLDGLQ